jgi:hypothetical protein
MEQPGLLVPFSNPLGMTLCMGNSLSQTHSNTRTGWQLQEQQQWTGLFLQVQVVSQQLAAYRDQDRDTLAAGKNTTFHPPPTTKPTHRYAFLDAKSRLAKRANRVFQNDVYLRAKLAPDEFVALADFRRDPCDVPVGGQLASLRDAQFFYPSVFQAGYLANLHVPQKLALKNLPPAPAQTLLSRSF